MVDALVVCGVHTERQLQKWLSHEGIASADVVSVARPVQAIAHFLRGDTGVEHDRHMGSLLVDAARLAMDLHQPERVVCFVMRRYFDSAFVENFYRFVAWLRDLGCTIPCEYRIVEERAHPVRVLGLTCIDWRLRRALEEIDPDDTAWMRLPGIEGLMAHDQLRTTLFTEMSLATNGGILTRAVRVRMDPHQDCAARARRHRRPEMPPHEWFAQDLVLMRDDHAAAQRFFRGANISCVNPSDNPARWFARREDGTFSLQSY